MADIGAQEQPCAKESWEGCEDQRSEKEGDDCRRRARVRTELVIDLRLLAVAKGRLGVGLRNSRIGGDGEVKGLAAKGCRGAKGCNGEIGR